MGKSSKRTFTTVICMTILAIVIVLCYYYWSNRTEPISTQEKLSEAQELINKDLVLYYPDTPREVTKVFASMMKALYGEPKEEEIKPLALKIRELYDKKFLDSNPEDSYLTNLITDLAVWKEHDRKIVKYLLVKEDEEQDTEIDGIKYATKFVSFTIQEGIRFTETWKVLLRQGANGQWKILGWEFVQEEDSKKMIK